MKLLRTFPIMVMALVVLSIVGVCAAEQRGKLLVVAVVLAVVSWYVTEGPRGRVLPRWVANLLVIAASITVVIDLLVPPVDVAGILGRFAIWLTIIKLYQRRTARDHAHLMALSLLLMLVGCLRTDVLLFGIVLVLYAVTGLYVLLLYQLYAAHEAATERHRAALAPPVGAGGARSGAPAAAPLAPALTPAPEPALAAILAPSMAPTPAPTIGRSPAFQFRALAAGIGSSGLLLSTVLFVIFPRGMGLGMMSPFMRVSREASVSGYTNEIDLDRGTRISASRRPVFELRILDDAGRSVRLDHAPLLRGEVLDRYRDGRWRASDRRRSVKKETGAGPLALGPIATTDLVRQSYRFYDRTRTIFTMYVPATIRTDRPMQLRYAPATQTLRSGGGLPLGAYTVESVLEPSESDVALLTEGARGRGPAFRDVSSADMRRVTELARSLLVAAGVPPEPSAERWRWNAAAARALRNHLRSGGFEYALDLSGIRREGDPIVSFLFESRRGHCEFFASALALLCHSIGIEARVVTGYAASEFEPDAAIYIVRASNAHAWVEVPVGEYRFVAVDPTPPDVLRLAASDLPLADRLGWLYQRLEGTWTSHVIQFDDRAQAGLIDAFDVGWAQRLGTFVDSARDWAAAVNRAFRLGPAGYIWLGIVALALLIAIVALARLARRFRLIRRTLGLRHGPGGETSRLIWQTGFYVDMLAALQRGGTPKPPWQPPLRFARALARKDPAAGELVRQIANVYYRARYAGRVLSTEEIRRAGRLVRELDGALRASR